QVEDQLNRRARVDATEHHGQRELTNGRGMDLPTQIAREPAAGAESFVAAPQKFQRLLGGAVRLQFACRKVSVQNLVGQLEPRFESAHAHLDSADRSNLLFELSQQTQHIGIKVVRVVRVQQHVPSARNAVEGPFYGGPI